MKTLVVIRKRNSFTPARLKIDNLESNEREWRTLRFLSKVEQRMINEVLSPCIFMCLTHCLRPSVLLHLVPVHFWKRLLTFSVRFCQTYTWLLLGPCILQPFNFNFSHQLRLSFLYLDIHFHESIGEKELTFFFFFFENSIYSSFSTRHGHLRFCLSGCLRHFPNVQGCMGEGTGERWMCLACWGVSSECLGIVEGDVLSSLLYT